MGNRLNPPGDSWDICRNTVELPHSRGIEAETSTNSYLALLKGCFCRTTSWQIGRPARYVGRFVAHARETPLKMSCRKFQ